MSFEWEQFGDWYTDIRYCIQRAVNGLEVSGEDGKKRIKGAALQMLMRDVSDTQFNTGTFANKLTPTSERHDLSLMEAWRIIDITNDVHSLMTLARHKNMLITPRVSQIPVSEEVLVPVFTKMRKELSETQDLIRQSLEEKNSIRAAVSISTKKELKREVYEDLCAAIAMVTHLEAMMIASGETKEYKDPDARYDEMVNEVACWAQTMLSNETALESFLAKSDIRRADLTRFSHNAKDETSGISLKLFLKAVEADQSNTLLELFCDSLGYRIFPLEPRNMDLTSKSVLLHFAELEGRQADTLNRLNQALVDKCVTHQELTEISEELKEEYGAELALLNEFTEIAPIS